MKMDAWRQAVGASIFWKTPIGPLRLILVMCSVKKFMIEMNHLTLTISTRF